MVCFERLCILNAETHPYEPDHRWSPKEEQSVHTVLAHELKENVAPLLVDATTEYLAEACSGILERVAGPAESETFAKSIQFYVLSKCHTLLVEQSAAER